MFRIQNNRGKSVKMVGNVLTWSNAEEATRFTFDEATIIIDRFLNKSKIAVIGV